MMPETRLVNRIIRWLNDQPSTRARKGHGSVYQTGEPDVDAVVCGRAVKLEVKLPGEEPTALQARVLALWEAAGAVVGVVTSLDEAQAIVAPIYEESKV
jgi:hypothetical protein